MGGYHGGKSKPWCCRDRSLHAETRRPGRGDPAARRDFPSWSRSDTSDVPSVAMAFPRLLPEPEGGGTGWGPFMVWQDRGRRPRAAPGAAPKKCTGTASREAGGHALMSMRPGMAVSDFATVGGHRNPRAKKKAAVAVAHTLILIIHCVLDRKVPYQELGDDFCTRRQDPERYKDKLIARLAKLGYTVTVEPAQAA
jgi:hypothetical protein